MQIEEIYTVPLRICTVVMLCGAIGGAEDMESWKVDCPNSNSVANDQREAGNDDIKTKRRPSPRLSAYLRTRQRNIVRCLQ